MLRATHSVAALTVVGLALSAAVAPAQAAAPDGSPTRGAAAPADVDDTSLYQAGYKRDGDLLTSASAKFTVPEVDCAGVEDFTGIAVGIGNEPREFDVTFLAVVLVRCDFTQPFYMMEASAGGGVYTGDAFNVAAGDEIKVSFEQDAPGDTSSAMVENFTSGEIIRSDSISLFDTSVTFGAFPLILGGYKSDVPDFGEVRFTKNKVDGERIEEGLTKYNREDELGVLEIKTGKLSDKGAFDLIYKSS